MLALRPNCEHCGKDLPNTSTEAMICSFECTYCTACALELFKNVCPSCGGNFVPRPIRPAKLLQKYPASTQKVIIPKKINEVQTIISSYKDIPPHLR